MSAGTSGAIVEDERSAMKIMGEARRMIDQRRRRDQVTELVGSVGES